jgi:hypothetical protein
MVKKNLVFLVFVSVVTSGQLFAEVPKLSFGGGALSTNDTLGGGFADFNFLVFNKNSLDIRNHIVFRGAGFDGGGLLSLGDKISMGFLRENEFRSYGYVEGGLDVWANKNKHFLEEPLGGSIGFGGGTDIFLTEAFSIFFEAGGLMHLFDGDVKGSALFQIGWRVFK